MEILHLAGTLMEHFFEGNAPLRLWLANAEEKILYLLLFSFDDLI